MLRYNSTPMPCSECPDVAGIVRRAVYAIEWEGQPLLAGAARNSERRDPVCAGHLGIAYAYALKHHVGFVPVYVDNLVPVDTILDTETAPITRELIAA